MILNTNKLTGSFFFDQVLTNVDVYINVFEILLIDMKELLIVCPHLDLSIAHLKALIVGELPFIDGHGIVLEYLCFCMRHHRCEINTNF